MSYCKICGKYVKDYPSYRRTYCSQDCYYRDKEKIKGRSEKKKNGEIVSCDMCGREVYKSNTFLKKYKNHFCCKGCANEYQKRNKVKLFCDFCGKEFHKSKSLVNDTYNFCSIVCRDKHPFFKNNLVVMNNNQSKKKGLNKLEERGRSIIEELGIKKYKEQYVINNKFNVDVYIPEFNLVIEWWGDYWHGNKKNKEGELDDRQSKRVRLDNEEKKYLEKCGINFLSFWEHEVYKNSELVKKKIKGKISDIKKETI